MVHLQTKLEEKHYKKQRHIVLEQMALKMHVALKIQQSWVANTNNNNKSCCNKNREHVEKFVDIFAAFMWEKKNEFFHLAKNNEEQVAAAVWAKTQQVARILVVISHFKQEDRQTDGRKY